MKKARVLMIPALVLSLVFSSVGVRASEITDMNSSDVSLTQTVLGQKDGFLKATKSENRLKYEQLLEGNYFAGELIQKFHELFGDGYSAEFIRNNYTTIFDLDANEIDEGLLNIIANLDHSDQGEASDVHLDKHSQGNDNISNKLYNFEPPFDAPLLEPPQATQEEAVFYSPESYEQDNTVINTQTSEDSIIGVQSLAAIANPMITYVSKTNTSVTFDISYPNSSDVNNILRMYDKSITNSWSYLLGREGKPAATNQRYTASGLVAGGVYTFKVSTYDFTTAAWLENEITVQTSGAKSPSVSQTSSSATSFTLSVVFPTEAAWGNKLEYWNGSTWIDVTGQGLYSKSGTYTVNNVVPGKSYQVSMRYYDHMTSSWPPAISLYGSASLPAENMQTYSKSNMVFRFDKWFADMFSAGRLDRFLNKVNAAYDVELGFVGGGKPFNGEKMGYETSRNMPTTIEGLSGQPITWSIYNTTYHVAPDHVLKMNQLDVDMTETPIHEIGHNFQKSRWNFEAEALTIFQIYYYMKTTSDSIAVSNQDTAITGSAFKTYMKSYANRIQGHINYDAAMAQGVYSPYSLAYNLADISDRIGFEPFKKTFRTFDEMSYSEVPTTSVGKFNLFISLLSTYSGQNVFAMFSSNEKGIYEAKLGGRIESPIYLTRAEAVDIARHHNEEYLLDEGFSVGSAIQALPLYDGDGLLFAYAVPYLNAQGTVMEHINVGALREYVSFYSISHESTDYNAILSWYNQGYNICFDGYVSYGKLPYYLNSPTGAISENAIKSKDNSNSATAIVEKMLNTQSQSSSLTSLPASQAAQSALDDVRLQSEYYQMLYPNYGNKYMPLFLNIVDGNSSGNYSRYYGGYQKWGTWLDYKAACGPIALSNTFIYLAIKDYAKYGALFPTFTTQPSPMTEISKTDYTNLLRDVSGWYAVGGTSVQDIVNAAVEYGYQKNITNWYTNNPAFPAGDPRPYVMNPNFYATIKSSDIVAISNFVKSSLSSDIPVMLRIGKGNTDIIYTSTQDGSTYIGDYHWVTITKYYQQHSGSARYAAISSWGERYSINFDACAKTTNEFLKIGIN